MDIQFLMQMLKLLNYIEKAENVIANLKKYFLVNAEYWADNGTEIGEKWEAMKAGL